MIFLVVACICAAILIIRSSKGAKQKIVTFTTPTGQTWDLFKDALQQHHLLIAGASGSGKSVLINGLMNTMLYRFPFDQPGGAQMILIDPKRVELAQYRNIPHTLAHAAGYNPSAWIKALSKAIRIMDERYSRMEAAGQRMYNGADIYVVIDEWASVYKSEVGKQAYKMILRLTSEGRAARVHVILATQVPKANIIPTEIRENMTARFALHTANAIQSRVIMEQNGCETLPKYGQGYYLTPEGCKLYSIPYVQENEIESNLNWWKEQLKKNGIKAA